MKPAPGISRPWICSTFRQLATKKTMRFKTKTCCRRFPLPPTFVHKSVVTSWIQLHKDHCCPIYRTIDVLTEAWIQQSPPAQHQRHQILTYVRGQMWQITRARPSGGKIGKGVWLSSSLELSDNGLNQLRLKLPSSEGPITVSLKGSSPPTLPFGPCYHHDHSYMFPPLKRATGQATSSTTNQPTAWQEATSLSEFGNLSRYRFGDSRFRHQFRPSPQIFFENAL